MNQKPFADLSLAIRANCGDLCHRSGIWGTARLDSQGCATPPPKKKRGIRLRVAATPLKVHTVRRRARDPESHALCVWGGATRDAPSVNQASAGDAVQKRVQRGTATVCVVCDRLLCTTPLLSRSMGPGPGLQILAFVLCPIQFRHTRDQVLRGDQSGCGGPEHEQEQWGEVPGTRG